MKNMLNIVGFIIQKVRKRTAERIKIYAAFLYNKKISEITKEDIQKIFDEITARKHYVTANNRPLYWLR
ncbi:integrase [Orientia tsutsugamushi]|uniref:Integrase n=3 Tax=Orientia tsutsugamushi TaxID=784 RepID=A0A2U3QSW3_ORITS|nr:putative integrase [Orientia tsutsugamushi str. Ikeda]SPR04041.1 integrase [Orientia tsutsugamushi]SPR07040.1 integrase [Orientia tsutsugamushi]SPR07663.1 integrase [Orientia tsutsugamushi]SPR10417.1 integrase [Orientia tsutsugamushi]